VIPEHSLTFCTYMYIYVYIYMYVYIHVNIYMLIHIGYGGESSGSASSVISEHLLTFDNVSELVTKNEQLMRVVRKLSEEQEVSS
jgi:hypothetical protein